MYQESGYRYDAKTPRKYLLWVIPWGRVSTASGYAQAKDEVWADYQKSTGRNWADREDFDDAIVLNPILVQLLRNPPSPIHEKLAA